METADSLQSKASLCLMADGQLESIWPQFLYAKRALSLVTPVLKVTLFLLLHCTVVQGCFFASGDWGVLTRLDKTRQKASIQHTV